MTQEARAETTRRGFVSVRVKLVVVLLLATVPMVALLGYFALATSTDLLWSQNSRSLEELAATRARQMGAALSEVNSDVKFLVSSADVRRFALACADPTGPSKQTRSALLAEFTALAQATNLYNQVRYIDSSGKERARVNVSHGVAAMVPDEELQDKSDRYYFRESINLPPGDVYVSPLDLNREQGEIERPIRPVIRYAAPVIEGGETLGVVILNVEAGPILPAIGREAGEVFLADTEGWYLSHSNRDKAWSGPSNLNTGLNMQEDLGCLAARLRQPLPFTMAAGGRFIATWPVMTGEGRAARHFILAVGTPEAVFLANVREFRSIFRSVLVVSFVVPVLAGLLLGAYFLRPLRQVDAAVRAVAEGNLESKATVRSRDEFEHLANDFNMMAERLRESRKQERLAVVGRLAGDISHDIKNMLTPVQTGAETLDVMLEDMFADMDEALARPDLPEQAREDIRARVAGVRELYPEMVEMLLDGSISVQERVREIADYVKGASGEPQLEPTSVQDVVAKAIKPLALLGDKSGVKVSLEADAGLPEILVDPKRLYTAVYNLVNNAIPETPPGGSVKVRLSAIPEGEFPEGSCLVIAVADTGKGMPEEIRLKLFTDDVQSTKPGGTGLGTSIVRNVVEAHGGTIAVASELGKGTTITMRLPLVGDGAG